MNELQQLKKWWEQPTVPDETTHAMAQKVLEQYPWFAPARLTSFLYRQQSSGQSYFPPLQEYTYNPLRYYEAIEDMEMDVASRSSIVSKEPDIILESIQSQDYFLHQGIRINDDLPPAEDYTQPMPHPQEEEAKNLMVMMSFGDWLQYFKTKREAEQEEEESKKALRTHWQKEKLAAALEEENEEIPEQVFEMAMNSIQQDEEPISEVYAQILSMQGKHTKAIEMYRKLSLKYPDKSGFFAAQIEKIRNQIN